MSHYQHNINAPHFPPGVHMAHYSLANTTLIGQEVQQRLWEKYWGHQCPAPTTPYMWYHSGMCYHGYPYGVPPTFDPACTHAGLVQSQQPVLSQRNKDESSNGTADQTSKSCLEKDVVVEVLEEGNSWQRNTGGTFKHRLGFNSSGPKTVDPVTDDLNWNMFSSDLADGIVVSILDSFVLELPPLDFTLVQSVFKEIDKMSPQPEAQVQPSTAKKEYFQDIVSLPQTPWLINSDETHSNKAGHSHESAIHSKKLDYFSLLHAEDGTNKSESLTAKTDSPSSGFNTIGKTFPEGKFCSAVPISSPDKLNRNQLQLN